MTASRAFDSLLQAAGLPPSLHAPVSRWADRLADSGFAVCDLDDAGSPSQTDILRLVAASEFAAGVLLRDWAWFTAARENGDLAKAPATSTAAKLLSDVDVTDSGVLAAKSLLRRYRNRQLLHILVRMIGARDEVWASLAALSALANAMLTASMQYASRWAESRYGIPLDSAGKVIPPVVLAMGKLGGGELNFSSDIDLVFLYPEEGQTDGPRKLSAHEYFTRFSRQVVGLLDETTADGFVYRVDTRLRPFGDSGPPVVGFNALENYLLQHGRSWERYAYIKANVIAPSAPVNVIDGLKADIIEPFVYRQYLDYGVFESLRDMKAMIEAEVRQRKLQNNIKLGPGGIREIEFIVQSLQLVRGGADRQLRQQSLRQSLARLGHGRGLGEEAVATLFSAYEFLRRFENGVQAIRDQQTHEIPVNPVDRDRLALIMNYPGWAELAADLDGHRRRVTGHFSEVAFRSDNSAATADGDDPGDIRWSDRRSGEDWERDLAAAGFDEAGELAQVICKFRESSVHRQIDTTAAKRIGRFMDSLLPQIRTRGRPARVCLRVITVLAQIARRSAYVALLNENPQALARLIDICEQSAYLTDEIARYPILLDELLDSRLYIVQTSKPELQRDLEIRLQHVDPDDSEGKIESLAQFQRATLFRIAVADIGGKLPIMKVSDGLTWLAEVVLTAALDVAWKDLAATHGEPVYEVGGEVRQAGLGVIAYGKLGGIELSYQSDLDLVFLHDSRGTGQITNGDRPLDNTMFFSRLVRRLVHFLTTQTSSGILYEVDTRLRPSGRSGLLVVSTEGFEKYQEANAWTWEHQALLRSRPVAGSVAIAGEFNRIRADTLLTRVRRDALLKDVLAMRKRMRRELDRSNGDHFDLKQGAGGIGDIEFLVQYLVLKHAATEPALIHYSDNIRQLDALHDASLLDSADVAQLQETYRSYRLRSHRLALDGKPSLVAGDEFREERGFVVAVWKREMK